jgi:phosphoglycolate phosphatase
MKLIIFDLDQTLVDVIQFHDSTMGKVFRDFFQVEAKLTDIDFAGKSLVEIFPELAAAKSIPPDIVENNLQKLVDKYEQYFIQNFPSHAESYILPGAWELLTRLSKTDNIVVLYTGNPASIGEKVLTSTKLKMYFTFSFFGTEVKARADMVKMAIERAEQLTGRKFRNKDLVIIGDSTKDIECGKQFNAITIAVTTGFHSESRLREAEPDFIFPGLTDTTAILNAIG